MPAWVKRGDADARPARAGARGRPAPGERVERAPAVSAPASAASGTDTAPLDAEHDQRDRGERRAAGDADDVGRDERVARDVLEDGAGDPERGAGQQAGQRARQPQVEHDEVRRAVARAGQRGDDVERRDRELAQRDARDERRDVAASSARPARRATRQVEAAAPGHSATSRRRRTSQMKNGAPSERRHDPDAESAGRASTRPSTSLASSSTAPSTMLYGTIQR